MSARINPIRYFHPVLASKDLGRRPRQVRVAGTAYALFRDGDGRAAALADACPHRHAPLSRGRVRPDGRIECSYHGWNFASDGAGHCPSQPTLRCRAHHFQVVERYGAIWMAAPDTPESSFPEMEFEGFDLAGHFSMVFGAPLHICLDNFSEDEHFPWVHTRLGWNERGLEKIEFEARNFDDRSEVEYRGVQRPSRILPLIGIRTGDHFSNRWVTRFDPPRALFTLSWADSRTEKPRALMTRVMVFMVPETEKTTRFQVFQFVRIDPSSRLRWFRALLQRATLALGWREIRDDARFIARMADTAEDLTGMRLSKYDKPVVHNRKLLKRIYWGEEEAPLRAPVSLVP